MEKAVSMGVALVLGGHEALSRAAQVFDEPDVAQHQSGLRRQGAMGLI